MKLNNTSYCHVKIRKSCQLLAYFTKMELLTDLSEEFDQVRFASKLSYITIDYKKNACFVMSHRLTKTEQNLIDDIMVYLRWLEIGERYQRQHK